MLSSWLSNLLTRLENKSYWKINFCCKSLYFALVMLEGPGLMNFVTSWYMRNSKSYCSDQDCKFTTFNWNFGRFEKWLRHGFCIRHSNFGEKKFWKVLFRFNMDLYGYHKISTSWMPKRNYLHCAISMKHNLQIKSWWCGKSKMSKRYGRLRAQIKN